MLSQKEALQFLERTLKIPHVQMKLKENRLQLLNDLLRATYAHIPYQNFRLLSIPAKNRVVLTPSEYICDCSSTLGGTCHVLNSFTYMVLKSLGFQVRLTGCNVDCHPTGRVQHLLNLVSGVKEPNDLYMVDPGAWCPTFEALPLHDWENESKVYHQSYLEMKLIREGDVITRCHRRSKIQLFKPEEGGEEWFRLYHFTLEPISIETIENDITTSYKERESGCVLGLSFSLFPYGKAVALKNYKLFVFDEDSNSLVINDLKSAEEITKALNFYCKGISSELVTKAISNLTVEKEYQSRQAINKEIKI